MKKKIKTIKNYVSFGCCLLYEFIGENPIEKYIHTIERFFFAVLFRDQHHPLFELILFNLFRLHPLHFKQRSLPMHALTLHFLILKYYLRIVGYLNAFILFSELGFMAHSAAIYVLYTRHCQYLLLTYINIYV